MKWNIIDKIEMLYQEDTHFNILCGLSCTRDIALENEGYELELEHPVTPMTRDIIPSPSISNSRRNSVI
jgi:hypothetical protein